MIFFIGLLTIFAAFAFVAYPLIKPSPKDEVMEDELESELQFKKESTFSAIKELEFDYALGNLSPEDHRDLEDRYKEKAIKIMKDMDGLETEVTGRKAPQVAELDDMEREILMARGKGGARDLEDEIRAARGKKAVAVSRPFEPLLEVCPSCNKKVSSVAKFCSSCGAALSLACPSCGKPVKRGTKFCSECGAKLN